VIDRLTKNIFSDLALFFAPRKFVANILVLVTARDFPARPISGQTWGSSPSDRRDDRGGGGFRDGGSRGSFGGGGYDEWIVISDC
jgi:hypothetical protein